MKAVCLSVAVVCLLGSPAAWADLGQDPTGPSSGPDYLPPPTDVTGKEYSNDVDEDAAGVADPLQVIWWVGDGTAADTFDYTGSGIDDGQVDALANSQDAFYAGVRNDQNPIVLSFNSCVLPALDGQIYYQMASGANGIWVTPPQINSTANPDDVDGLELWGPNPQGNDDSVLFSVQGDPGGTAIFAYNGTDTTTAYLSTVALQGALDTSEEIDLDALMAFDVDDDGEWGEGDSIIFSIKAIGPYDGGELWVWDYGQTYAQYLVHGGVTWNTAFDVGTAFGVGTEEVNALEAVPEPATMALLAVGAAALMGCRRR